MSYESLLDDWIADTEDKGLAQLEVAERYRNDEHRSRSA